MVGDVVLAPFPYTDLTDSKIRPVLILSQVGMGDWIVCEITTRRRGQPGDIAIDDADFLTGNLRRPSAVRYDRMHTLNDRLFKRTIGSLTDAKRAEIAAAVRGLF